MQRKKIIALTICFVMAMSMALALRQVYAAGSLYVSPASTTAVLNNDYIIQIKVTADDLYGWEFQLDYNKTILELTYADIVTGTLNTPTNTFQNVTDETTGHLWWAVATKYPTLTGANVTDGAIFEIHFHTIAVGTSSLHLSGTILSDSNANAIAHTTTDGSIDVYGRDLTVTGITVLDLGCSIYKNDTNAANAPYYVPVEVTVKNTGTLDAGEFHVELEVYYVNGSTIEAEAEMNVTGLAAGASTTLNFTALFHPMNTDTYRLTATADNRTEVSEDDETNNSLTTSDIIVTVIGDINHDHTVNILDAVVMSKAWDSVPGNAWWNIKADINHSGTVSITDGTKLGTHWGESW